VSDPLSDRIYAATNAMMDAMEQDMIGGPDLFVYVKRLSKTRWSCEIKLQTKAHNVTLKLRDTYRTKREANAASLIASDAARLLYRYVTPERMAAMEQAFVRNPDVAEYVSKLSLECSEQSK